MFLNKSKFISNFIVVNLFFITMTVTATDSLVSNAKPVLTFETAIKVAQQNDPWLTGNIHQQHSVELMGQAASSLPDPNIAIGLANLPVDGFDFSQEAMTQAKIGITQVFPRGDTLDLKSQQYKVQSEAFPFQRQDREAKVAVTVGSLWLEAYRAQKSIRLIETNRALFEQLADVAQANYSSALARTRQQDIVRSQLELTRLEERLDKLLQQKSQSEGMLSQWLIEFSNTASNTITNKTLDTLALNSNVNVYNIEFGDQLPHIDLLNTDISYPQNALSADTLIQQFNYHPSVLAIDKKVMAVQTGIKLAQQKYKPQWGVNASYGYRDDAPSGLQRDDLFSVGITFDLPLFTDNKQDKEVQSAISTTAAVKTEKLLLLRQLLSAYATATARLQGIKSRQTLYKSRLLPQIHDHAEASLSAYTNDDGDFSEVVRSRIAVLNTEIDQLNLDVDEQKLNLELNYLFIGTQVNRAGNISTNRPTFMGDK